MRRSFFIITLAVFLPILMFGFSSNLPGSKNVYDPIRGTSWGNDISVLDGVNARSISYDYDAATGNMYASIITDYPDTGAFDTIYIMKSTDYGNTWYHWITIPEINDNRPIKAKLLFIPKSDSPYVDLISRWTIDDTLGFLWSITISANDSSNYHWTRLTSPFGDSNNVYSFDAAANESSIYVVYAGYDTSNGSLAEGLYNRVYNIAADSGWNAPAEKVYGLPSNDKAQDIPAITAVKNKAFLAYYTEVDSCLNVQEWDSDGYYVNATEIFKHYPHYLTGLSIAASNDDTSTVWVGFTERDTSNSDSTSHWLYYYSTNDGNWFSQGKELYKYSGYNHVNGSMKMASNNNFVTIAVNEWVFNGSFFFDNIITTIINKAYPDSFWDSVSVINDVHSSEPVAGDFINNSYRYDQPCVLFAHDNGGIYFDYDANQTGIKITENNSEKNYFMVNSINEHNNSIKIDFMMNDNKDIDISVFNITGSKIATVFNGRLNEGRHILEWNGKDFNNRVVKNGIYLISIKSGSFMRTSKVVFLR